MAKKKLKRFAEIEQFPNVVHVIQRDAQRPFCEWKGRWNSDFFKNNHPLVLELGCGKGEYTVGLSQGFPDKNFIGADLKGNRIWNGAKTCLDKKIANAAFLRTRIENIDTAFAPGEVSEIWITFPDPQPQQSREKKRLTSQRFMDMYKSILKPGGIVHLKTDSFPLYQYTLEVISANNFSLLGSTSDLYADTNNHENELAAYGLKTIQTYYERLFSGKGFKICYLRFGV